MANNPEAAANFMSAGFKHVANSRTAFGGAGAGSGGGAGASGVSPIAWIYICLIDGGRGDAFMTRVCC
jgi:uncharacterized spore protein YtfJ